MGQGGEQGQQSKKRLNIYEKKKILYYFRSINCTNVSIQGCKCCKTDFEESKCVYLACMAVIIERTVGDHYHDILQQCSSDVYASRSMGPQPE